MYVKIGKPGDKRYKEVIRIDEWDTWSMDRTLSPIILPMLIQLKETMHGVPCSMPAYDEDPWGDSDETFEKAEVQWNEILDKMIWSFTQLCQDDDGEDQFWSVHPELDLDDYPEDEGKDAVPVRWKVPGEVDFDALKAHRERIKEGLELFGKYYQSLWD